MNQVIAIDDKEGRLAMRATIEQFWGALKAEVGDKGNADEVNAEGLDEYLVGGAYTRVLKIPAGETAVSGLWNRERLWIILYGTVHIRTELGDQKITGPYIGQAPFGSRVLLYAETETLWAAITGLPETDDVAEAGAITDPGGYEDLTYPWDALESKQ